MIAREEHVADLQSRVEASEATTFLQQEEMYQLKELVKQLETRTPRPDWPSMNAAGFFDPAGTSGTPPDADLQMASTEELVAKAATKMAIYASSLEVRCWWLAHQVHASCYDMIWEGATLTMLHTLLESLRCVEMKYQQ
jgi:hypothetical protein